MNSTNLTQEALHSEKVGFLLEQIDSELVLLATHVLSLTESLTWRTRVPFAERVNNSKRSPRRGVFAGLSEPLTQKLKSGTAILARATFQERQALAFLKTEGVQLLHQIQRIESNNRLRLEEFKLSLSNLPINSIRNCAFTAPTISPSRNPDSFLSSPISLNLSKLLSLRT